MEITKAGKIPDAHKQESVCAWCDTEFTWFTYEARMPDREHYELNCPFCGHYVTKSLMDTKNHTLNGGRYE